MEVDVGDVVLCKFYFSDFQEYKNRPVLVFKDNLPFDDFVAIPISSKIERLYFDEHIINSSDFSIGNLVVDSKLMLRKTFVVSKKSILKKYGKLSENSFKKVYKLFCEYFACKNI